MQVILYADVLLFVNWVIAFLCFMVCNYLYYKKVKWPRLFLASVCSSFLYLLLLYYKGPKQLHGILPSTFIIAVGITIAFYPFTVKQFFYLLSMAYIFSFLLGGIGSYFYFQLRLIDFLRFNFQYFTWYHFLISFCIACIIYFLYRNILSAKILHKQLFCQIVIHLNAKTVAVKALVDTGHRLLDNKDNPILICNYESLLPLFPKINAEQFYQQRDFSYTDIQFLEKRLLSVSFHSVGTNNGFLWAFQPDLLVIYVEKRQIKTSNMLIAMVNQEFQSGIYQAIISPIAIK